MNVLFDDHMSYDHAKSLPGHTVYTSDYMGWKGFSDPALVEKAVSHGFHAIVSKDRDGHLEKANASLGSPLLVIEIPVPKGARGPKSEETVEKHMPEVLKQLNEHQRTHELEHERKARERDRGPEDIRSLVERVAQSMGVTLPSKQQEPPRPRLTDRDRELTQSQREVRSLCDQIASGEKGRDTERPAPSQEKAQEQNPELKHGRGPKIGM